MIHQLKIEKQYFDDILSCRKRFEVRNNDREFCVGDILGLNEINKEGKETGRCTLAEIVYILQNYMLQDGYVVLGIEPFPKKNTIFSNSLPETIITNREGTANVVNGYLVIE